MNASRAVPRRRWGAALGIGLLAAVAGWLVFSQRNLRQATEVSALPAVDVRSRPAAAAVAPGLEPIFRQAREAAQRLVARFPQHPAALSLAAHLYQQAGDTAAAIPLWQECLQLDPQFLDARLAIGTFLFESGEFAQAEQVLQAAFLQAPEHPQVAYLLGNALLNQGKVAETAAVLEPSLAGDPRAALNQVLLGQALLGLRQYERAKACFQTAIELAPDYPNAYFGLTSACEALGEADEAAQSRRKFRELQTHPQRRAIDQTARYDDLQTTRREIAEFYVVAGGWYQERGDVSAAEQHWQQALDLAPESARGRAALAQSYAETGRLRQAVAVLLPLQQTHAADLPFWQRLADWYARLQEFDEADAALSRIVELAPDQAAGYAARARLRLQLERDPAEAADLARQAVQRAPSAAHYFLWSVACQRSGDQSQAKAAIVQALEREPTNPQYQQQYLTLEAKR